jgi:hypothetical protein
MIKAWWENNILTPLSEESSSDCNLHCSWYTFAKTCTNGALVRICHIVYVSTCTDEIISLWMRPVLNFDKTTMNFHVIETDDAKYSSV